MIKVITDSTADLTPDLARRFDLDVVPLYVRFGEEICRDGVDFTPASFLAKLTASKEFPKTAQPTPGDFTAVFR
ncbi:MAG: DegV family protein, partial [Bacteroidota bacterium]